MIIHRKHRHTCGLALICSVFLELYCATEVQHESTSALKTPALNLMKIGSSKNKTGASVCHLQIFRTKTSTEEIVTLHRGVKVKNTPLFLLLVGFTLFVSGPKDTYMSRGGSVFEYFSSGYCMLIHLKVRLHGQLCSK